MLVKQGAVQFPVYIYIRLYFKHLIIYKGLGTVYGQLHIYFEEQESPPEKLQESVEVKESSFLKMCKGMSKLPQSLLV